MRLDIIFLRRTTTDAQESDSEHVVRDISIGLACDIFTISVVNHRIQIFHHRSIDHRVRKLCKKA